MSVKRASIALGILLAGATAARGLDLTNTWLVTVGGPPCIWTLAQTGSALTLVSSGGCLPYYQISAAGTVDEATATFTATGTVYVPPVSESIVIAATVSAGEAEFTGTVTGGGSVQPISGRLCGNGNLDSGEQCDGGTSTSDCCNDGCTPEPDGQSCSIPPHDQCATDLACAAGACVGTPRPAGTPCWVDGSACTLDQCDGAGLCTTTTCSPCCLDVPGCGAGPVLPSDCAAPGGARSVFVLETGIPDDRDRLLFRLPGAVGPNATDFGDPTTGTGYFLCVARGDYEVGVRLLLTAQIPPGGSCGTTPCWRATPRGFLYRDRLRTADGVATLRLRAVRGKGGIRIVARGPGVSREFVTIPPFPEAVPPGFWVQLRSADRCWGAYYTAPDVFEPGHIRAMGGE